jgi:HK97 family phage portal protein
MASSGLLERIVETRNVATNASRIASVPGGGFGSQYATPNLSEAYYRNVTINAGLRLLARQVAEPSFVGRKYRRGRADARRAANHFRAQGLKNSAGAREVDRALVLNGFTEQVVDHPLVELLNTPNPFMTGDELWGLTVVLDQWMAGNAYVLKGRTDLGNAAELWRLRPDRVRIIPDEQEFIAGYEYKVGQKKFVFPRDDIMHIKTLNPDNPYYGTPLLLPVIDSLSIDAAMKGYLKTFYLSGGSGPGAILSVEGELTQEEKEELRERKRRIFGGAAGAHEWLILDNTKTTYQSLGLDRGLAAGLPKEIAAVIASELSMALGIPGSILGQLIGYESSSYANKRADWQVIWDITLTPQMEGLDNAINKAFLDKQHPEFRGIDEIYSSPRM